MHAVAFARANPGRVRRLTLVSPAAPLQAGDWLEFMDGAPVFTLARNHPALFTGLSRVQGTLARIAPGVLLRAMFKGADASEKTFADSDMLRAGLRGGFGADYRETVTGYLRDWRGEVEALSGLDVSIWSGTRDSWAPPGMAQWFADTLGTEVRSAGGAGHYGTLVAAGDEL